MVEKKGLINTLITKAKAFWNYAAEGVWSDTRSTFGVKLTKTLNLSVRSFFNGDIQTKACAMAFRTILSIVPALALVFAIGKGFGLQDTIKDELYHSFASQHELLDKAFAFVDSYLNQSSEGIFVGVGIALLLWTLISILGSVEKAFNEIWGVKNGRSFWRKITDYLAIFLILPVLMICSSGLTVFVSTTVESVFNSPIVTPMVGLMLDLASLVLIWLFFTGVYIMIPTTRVRFKNAFGAGVFAGTAFLILQWLFISGQVYVSKYNAIYGSFAFLPLFMIWVQLVWVITLAGAVICYASQNIFRFDFSTEISHISPEYQLKISVAILASIVNDYLHDGRTPTETDISSRYHIPSRLVNTTIQYLIDSGLLLRVIVDQRTETIGYAPALPPTTLTLGEVIGRIRSRGASGFIPQFTERFESVIDVLARAEDAMKEVTENTYIKDLTINITSNEKSNSNN